MIHRILPTKSSLFRGDIAESDTSSLCTAEKQTLIHLPYHCFGFLGSIHQLVVNLNEFETLYGWHKNIKNKQELNVTLLIAKISGSAVTTNTISSRQIHVITTYVIEAFFSPSKTDLMLQSKTSSNQRLRECVRRRNFNTDT